MRKVFKVLIGFALALALSVPMAVVGSGEVKAAGEVYINDTNFPDANFRDYLLSKTTTYTTDGSDKYYTQEQINSIVSINCSEKNIESLKGIEYFTALEQLYCENNQLTSLDVTKNTALTELVCYFNELTELDITKNTALTYLECAYNRLTSLDVTKNTALETLGCADNQLTSLDVTKNTALETLNCSNTSLASLDVTKNTALKNLLCINNAMKSLDITKNTALEYLNCDGNQLTSLDLTKYTALSKLACRDNQLTSLVFAKNIDMEDLFCDNNHLTSLDLPDNISLSYDFYSGSGQTSEAGLVIKDGKTYFDMKTFIGSNADINKVTITSDNWTLDKTTGLACYGGSDLPEEINYNYAINNGNLLLSVSVAINGVSYAKSDEENNNNASTSGDTTQTPQTPQTGDDSGLMIYLIIGALAAAGGTMIVASNKMEEE